MRTDNKRSIKFISFERRQWQHVEKLIHCFAKQQWQPLWKSTHCLLHMQSRDSKRKTTSIGFWKKAVEAHGNPSSIHCFLIFIASPNSMTTFMETHQLFSKYAVTAIIEKLHPLLFKREEWQHEKNKIHCLVKQQWQHMEIYPHLINFVKKLNAFLFKRD